MTYNGIEFNNAGEFESYLYDEWLNSWFSIALERGVADADMDEFFDTEGEKYVNDILSENCYEIVQDGGKHIGWAIDEQEADYNVENLREIAECGFYYRKPTAIIKAEEQRLEETVTCDPWGFTSHEPDELPF